MKTADFDYELPPEMIAQRPVEPRDGSRLLVVHRDSGEIGHRTFRDLLDYLRPNDLLVANDTRVIPARLIGRKETGGQLEVFLLRKVEPRIWEVLVGGRGLRPGVRVRIEPPDRAPSASHPAGARRSADPCTPAARLEATILDELDNGGRVVQFDEPVEPLLESLGVVPLPPYIHTPLADPDRYQTVYARVQGSVAAPTAGLHFTPGLIDDLQERGVRFGFVTLHVGLDTFQPVKTQHIEDHPMHSEWAELPETTAEAIAQARSQGGRVIAVGTTAVRVLETAGLAADQSPGSAVNLRPFRGWVSTYITPGYRFRVVDAMITNFHLPRSTLLMLVAAFAGKPLIDRAYGEAIAEQYRFYSFGDAMLIL